MAITVTAEPGAVAFAGNPIEYLLTSSSTAEVLAIGVELWVEDAIDSNTFTLKWKGEAPVDAAKQSRWELSDILSKYLGFVFPDLTATGKTAIAGTVKRCYIKTYEIEDGEPTATTTQSTKTVLLGGRSFAGHKILSTPSGYFFASTRPLRRSLHRNQRDWLSHNPHRKRERQFGLTLFFYGRHDIDPKY